MNFLWKLVFSLDLREKVPNWAVALLASLSFASHDRIGGVLWLVVLVLGVASRLLK